MDSRRYRSLYPPQLKLTPMGQPPGQASGSYGFYLVSHCTLGYY